MSNKHNRLGEIIYFNLKPHWIHWSNYATMQVEWVIFNWYWTWIIEYSFIENISQGKTNQDETRVKWESTCMRETQNHKVKISFCHARLVLPYMSSILNRWHMGKWPCSLKSLGMSSVISTRALGTLLMDKDTTLHLKWDWWKTKGARIKLKIFISGLIRILPNLQDLMKVLTYTVMSVK